MSVSTFVCIACICGAVGAKEKITQESIADRHCSKDEFTYFSCVLKNSPIIVSLCVAVGQAKEAKGDSHVEFRSGPISKIKFRFPSDLSAKAKDNFKGEFLKPYGENISVDTITFDFDGVSYGLSKTSGKWNRSRFWKYENGLATDTPCATPLADHSMRGLIYELPPLDGD